MTQTMHTARDKKYQSKMIKQDGKIIHLDRPQRSIISNNILLERMTLLRWYTPFMVWPILIVYLFYISYETYQHTVATYMVIFILGILFWTLAEYLIHRYPFHWGPKAAWGRKMVYLVHGNHHIDPDDPLRGVMPILPAALYISILYGIFYLITPAPYLDAFFASFLIGYLLYDGIHYYTHHGKPTTALGKYLRRYHLVHHVHDDIVFGISSPLWDYIFGTVKHKKQD